MSMPESMHLTKYGFIREYITRKTFQKWCVSLCVCEREVLRKSTYLPLHTVDYILRVTLFGYLSELRKLTRCGDRMITGKRRRLASQMQTCQPAAGLTLHRLPFSPWANQTKLWEGHPRLWCLCRRSNSAWQLLAFRQQPVFMEIILPYSGCNRLLLITGWMKTKLSFLRGFFFPTLIIFPPFLRERPKMSKKAYGVRQRTPCCEVIHYKDQYKLTADICFL